MMAALKSRLPHIERVVVAGLGKTGASCVRYLLTHGFAVSATDSRAAPPGLAELAAVSGEIEVRVGGFDLSLLDGASQLLLSPGLSLAEPIAVAAKQRGIEVLGDIELFARAARAPVVGVTGTNGKSTVTTLIAQMAQRDGRRVLAGGNLGTPALDLLAEAEPDLYVLELSSFQLETTASLRLLAAAVLNVTADHLDRYASLDEYARAKATILTHATAAILNVDDPRVAAMRREGQRTLTYSVLRDDTDFTLLRAKGGIYLARRGEPLLNSNAMKLSGLHNAGNALAALALGESMGLGMPAMVATLESFPGLPHRSEWIADIHGVRYIDDSKGTNVGATIAAVSGVSGPVVLIAGGEGKNQDFSALRSAFRNKVRCAILIGKDAASIESALTGICQTQRAASMEAAVVAAARQARSGETVLLSPACASLDMFRDYAHRGDVFAVSVRGLPGAGA